jgi:hypothetical protein
VDRIVKERLKRDGQSKQKLLDEFVKELGFEKTDDLKALIKSQKEAENAKKDELQKAQDAIAAAQKEAADAKAAAAQLAQERRLEKRDAAIVNALKEARASEADDLFILMRAKQPELLTAIMDDEGQLDKTALTKFVDATKAAYKSRFVGTSPGVPSNTGGKNPKPEIDFGDKPLVRF